MLSFIRKVAQTPLGKTLKPYIKRSSIFENLIKMHGTSLIGTTMRYIDNISDLDKELKNVDEMFKISDDEGRRALSEFCYMLKRDTSHNPHSQEYYDEQMRIYYEVSGRDSYVPLHNERSEFDFELLKNTPFPYCTKSSATTGDQLIGQGFLIRAMGLPSGANIVEFGPGWGNTTLHLAQMGYNVTAVEVEKRFIDLIHYRTEMLSQKVTLVHKDMLDFNPATKYDAAVFFESFHHCSDHLKLLNKLHEIISDDGIICFACEPIVDLPYPWGIRLDGISVWSIRKFGWFELGFDKSYFLRTLLQLGWTPKVESSDVSPLADLIIAQKSKLYYEPNKITLPPDECKTWAEKESDPNVCGRFSLEKSVMSCCKNVDAKIVEFCIDNHASFNINVTINAGSSIEKFNLPKKSSKNICKVHVKDWQGKITISSKTWRISRFFGRADRKKVGVYVQYVRIIL